MCARHTHAIFNKNVKAAYIFVTPLCCGHDFNIKFAQTFFMELQPVDRVDKIDAEDFQQRYYLPVKPVVITGLASVTDTIPAGLVAMYPRASMLPHECPYRWIFVSSRAWRSESSSRTYRSS